MGGFFFQKYNKNIKFTWFMSYLLILMVPFIISLAICIQMQYKVNDERLQRSRLRVENVVKNAELEITKSSHIYTYFRNHASVSQAMRLKAPMTEEKKRVLYEARQALEQYRTVYHINENVFLYLKDLDTILTPYGYFAPYDFYTQNFKECSMSYRLWKDAMESPPDNTFQIFSLVMSAGDRNFLQMKAVREGKISGVLAVQSKYDIFAGSGADQSDAFEYAIMDKENTVVFATEGLRKLRGGAMRERINIDGKNYMVSTEKSESTEYTYMVAIEPLETPLYIYLFVVLIIGCSIVSVLLLWRTIKKNYALVDNILNNLRKHRKPQADGDANEFEFVRRTLNNLDMETKRASELIAKQDRQLKANYLSRLLRGNTKEIETIEAGIREVNGITFLSDYFAVIQFFIEDYKGLFEGDRQLEEEQQIEIVRFAMKNVSEEMAEKQNNRGYMADMEDILTLIVSFAPENAENGMSQVKTLCEDIRKVMGEQLKIKITAAASNVHKSLMGIGIAYQEASAALEYRFMVGKERLIAADELESGSGGYGYTFEQEQLLINYIKTGNSQQAKNIVETVFQQVLMLSMPHVEIVRCLCFDMAATLMKAMDETKKYEAMESGGISRLLSCNDVEEMKTEICRVIDGLCVIGEDAKSEKLSSQVIRFIEENYESHDLSVLYISECMGIHHTYLSNAFKAQTGIGLLEYINRFRVQKAKELLRTTSKSVAEVADLVGYLSDKTFIRVFKRYTEFTPTQYRNSSGIFVK